MITRVVRVCSRAVPPTSGPLAGGQPATTDRVGRLIRIALALYLVPALAAVLVVGAVGLLVLAASRLVAGHGGGAAGWTGTPLGDGMYPP